MASEAQIRANRANALKSTGPKSAEGKKRSRANSLKHGLCASTLVAEDIDLIQKRNYSFYYTLKPQNEYQSWIVEKISVISVRLDRSERMERRYRDRKSLRAELAWGEDRGLEIEILGGKISKKPAEVVQTLRRSVVGCDWLLKRWKLLEDAAVASNGKGWNDEQRRVAFDLLGMPVEFREGRDPGQELSVDPPGPADLARREQDRLREHRSVVAELEEVDQALTEVDLFDESHPELKALRRHESTMHSRLRWCLAQLQYVSPHHHPHPDLLPRWTANFGPPMPSESELNNPERQVVAAAVPASAKASPELWELRKPCITPPFDLTPEEMPAPGEPADIPAIVGKRLEKKLKKAENRRDAKRRKAERLRA